MRPTTVLRKLSLTMLAPAMLAAAVLATSTGATAQEENVLHNFQYNGKDAAYPRAGVIFDKAGNLYGTSSSGGSDDGGAVFELTHKAGGGWTDTILYSFTPRPKYGADLISGLV